MTQSKVNLTTLPITPPYLFGRQAELSQLDAAWGDTGCNLLCLVGEEGSGKSSLIDYWLKRHLLPSATPDNLRVFGWSFYSQGSVANQSVAADFFIQAALAWFGETNPTKGSARDKGKRLANLIREAPTLLILDGLELLQAGQAENQIEIRDPALRVLLEALAGDNSGLALLSTSWPLANLTRFHGDNVRLLNLAPLSEEAGIAFIKAQGLSGRDIELGQIYREFEGHPFALALASSFVQLALAGDLTRLLKIPPLPADNKAGRPARRLLQAYRQWFGDSPELNILYLLGLFLRPPEPELLQRLLVPPAIAGLTDKLFTRKEAKALGIFKKNEAWPISQEAWLVAVTRLRQAQLLLPLAADGEDAAYRLDAHPLVRKYFARQLGNANPTAWYSGQERLYRHLTSTTEPYPDTLAELAPLYQAVAHGCRANKFYEALEDIYWERIARQQKLFSATILGAPGADLAALANAYRQPWQEPAQSIAKRMQATFLSWTATVLRALGRLAEAQQAWQAVLNYYKAKRNWKQVAVAAGHLSQVSLLLGDIPAALSQAQLGVKQAIRSRDKFQQLVMRAAEAAALHQAGRLTEAGQIYTEVEARQRYLQPHLPFLYSLRGYQYCDLLLSQGNFEEVKQRAGQTLELARTNDWPLYVALDQLSLGRAGLVELDSAVEQEGQPLLQTVGLYLDQAIAGLKAEKAEEFLPAGLLARADWHRRQAHWDQAQADLAEALEVARLMGLKLAEADVYLAQSRLAFAQGQSQAARVWLDRAKSIIEATGYHRRDGDVAVLAGQLGQG